MYATGIKLCLDSKISDYSAGIKPWIMLCAEHYDSSLMKLSELRSYPVVSFSHGQSFFKLNPFIGLRSTSPPDDLLSQESYFVLHGHQDYPQFTNMSPKHMKIEGKASRFWVEGRYYGRLDPRNFLRVRLVTLVRTDEYVSAYK